MTNYQFFALWALRLLLVAIFLYHGLNKVIFWSMNMEKFIGSGLLGFIVPIIGIVEIIASLLLLFGIFWQASNLTLLFIVAVTIVTIQLPNFVENPHNALSLERNLLILIGNLILLSAYPNRVLDRSSFLQSDLFQSTDVFSNRRQRIIKPNVLAILATVLVIVTSGIYTYLYTYWQQLTLDKTNREISVESLMKQQEQELNLTSLSNIEAEHQLQNVKALAEKGMLKNAIAVAIEVAPNSNATQKFWNKIADWTNIKLGQKLDQQIPPENVPARSLKWLGGNFKVGPQKILETKWGQIEIDANRSQWQDYQKPEGSLTGGRIFIDNFGDAWRETYDVVSEKMRLGVIYGCVKNITIQTEVYFNNDVELGLIKTKLNQMLRGQADPTIQQSLKQVYQGEIREKSFNNGRFIGLIRHLKSDEILIAVREV